uniref:Uncharacterized protein n=1 Tax=Molossus molossus TaxID=27622 RepID=A0A7J8GLG6_MOLMO|nr:hypothetical protein HJG59_011439 [Molossus molossus]
MNPSCQQNDKKPRDRTKVELLCWKPEVGRHSEPLSFSRVLCGTSGAPGSNLKTTSMGHNDITHPNVLPGHCCGPFLISSGGRIWLDSGHPWSRTARPKWPLASGFFVQQAAEFTDPPEGRCSQFAGPSW